MLVKRKKVLSLVLMTFLFLMISTSSFAFVCGDIDCSGGDPDITDITRLIDYLYLSHDPLCDPLLADVNDSGGEPDMSDVSRLIDFLYGSHEPLNCPPPATIMDIDGNIYHTIKIGDQWWLMENLRVTRYRNGDTIPNVSDSAAWVNLTTGAYCYYDNDTTYVETYGLLYNWYAIDDSCNIAPEGWHVSSDEEWKQLEMYLGMSLEDADESGFWRGTDEGGKLKETSTTHWAYPNTGATNESGFTALPGGVRGYSGSFADVGYQAIFWSPSATFMYLRILDNNLSTIYQGWEYPASGFSIRCVRD
ncbi:MAG: fibrobacter succinogenes major paralogous domain-containing protein [candidate division Zixibacteria bacterium]|nr:fibrobacter succinogenes major paralogous domain-containing protein [candidate division Zixibacteria bacterium]